MKHILILIFIPFLIGAKFAVVTDNGYLAMFDCSKNISFEDCKRETIEANNLGGNDTIDIDDTTEFPSVEDRSFWELKNGKIKVNQAKKNQHDADKLAKKQRLDTIKTTLGLTDADLDLIRKG